MLAHTLKKGEKAHPSQQYKTCVSQKRLRDPSLTSAVSLIDAVNASLSEGLQEVHLSSEVTASEAGGFCSSIAAALSERKPVGLPSLGKSWPCCKWTPQSLTRGPARDHPVRAFVSEQGRFHLDGTWNPRTVFTCSMATVRIKQSIF
jgi:hypothetical protein